MTPEKQRIEPPSSHAAVADGSRTEPPSRGILQTEALFAGRKELIIEHAGSQYRLRITQQNKLILTK